MKACLLTVFLGSMSILQAGEDSLTLRLIPGMEKHALLHIEVLNPEYAIALGRSIVLRWDGQRWAEFTPAPVNTPYFPQMVKMTSPENIWLFYQDERYSYRTNCMRFDGRTWRKVEMSQPSTLDFFHLLSPDKCLAVGGWGSLGVIEGFNMRNIQTIPNVKHRLVSAFSADHFLTRTQLNEYDERLLLYEYKDEEWHVLPQRRRPLLEQYFTPDSGIALTFGGVYCRIDGDELIPLDTIPAAAENGLDTNEWLKSGDINFWRNDSLYRYANTHLELVKTIPFVPKISTLGSGEYFLRNESGHLFYLGAREIGEPYSQEEARFGYDIIPGQSYDHGLSLYLNCRNQVDVYFTSPTHENVFFEFNGNFFNGFIDDLPQRGLFSIKQSKGDSLRPYDSSVFFADIDNDGDFDAILAALRDSCIVYENLGKDRFHDVTGFSGAFLKGRVYTIRWADINADGNLDFAVGENLDAMRIFFGNGNFRFEEVTQSLSLPDDLDAYLPEFSDTDLDGDLDMFLYSRFKRPRYFKNESSGSGSPPQFRETFESPQLTTRFDFYTQSVSWCDIDADGDSDLLLVNRMVPLVLFLNDGRGNFRDISAQAGFDQKMIAYGSNWGDLDQDGDFDLFITTIGQNYIYWNQGDNIFTRDANSLPVQDVGYSTGSGLVDLDRDGDLDILVANSELGRSCVYENLLAMPTQLTVRLNCTTSNRFGIGARVEFFNPSSESYSGKLLGSKEITMSEGYCSSSLPQAEFALSAQHSMDVQVTFPSGKIVMKRNVAGGQEITISEPTSVLEFGSAWGGYLLSFVRHPSRTRNTIFVLGFLSIYLLGYRVLRRLFWTREQIFLAGVPLIIAFVLTLIFYPLSYTAWFAPPAFLVAFNLGWMGTAPFVARRRSSRDLVKMHRLLSNFQHGEVGIKHLEHIQFLGSASPGGAVDAKKMSQVISELDSFSTTGYPELQRILREARNVKVDLVVLSRLRNSLKLMMSFSRARESQAIPSSLFQTADSLKSSIVRLQREVDGKLACRLKAAINQSVELALRDSEIQLQLDLPAEEQHVVISQPTLVRIISDLLNNSSEAMAIQSQKVIRLQVTSSGSSSIKLMIEDSGPGVDPGFETQIFDEGFTGKKNEGRGHGLAWARDQLGHFGAKIELCSEGTLGGACFVLTLRRLRDE